MLFNSFPFLLFFAVVYLLYRVLPHRFRGALLLGASWFFYGWWSWRFLALLITTTAADFLIGVLLEDTRGRQRRFFVTVSIVMNLGVLGAFKYLGFFVQQADHVLAALGAPFALPLVQMFLPVGLSFYVFQSMAYTIDVYRARVRAVRRFPRFALFVAFFPQLVAGPISRAADLVPQLADLPDATAEQRARGTQLILWGYFKKVVIADNLAVIVHHVFDASGGTGGFLTLAAAYAYTWQIYCDFSGYTDIARGLARWLGIELVENFNLPFFADSPRDLWHRWHISLSTWLRDYLYIPLGGNRRGELRTRLNLMATMLLGGLWHGANWTFVAWGAWHGVALAVQRAVPRFRLPRAVAIVAMFHFTCFGFLIFRAPSLARAAAMFTAMAVSLRPSPGDLAVFHQIAILALPVGLVEVAQYLRDDRELLTRMPVLVQAGASMAMLICIIILGASYGRQFIYFQF